MATLPFSLKRKFNIKRIVNYSLNPLLFIDCCIFPNCSLNQSEIGCLFIVNVSLLSFAKFLSILKVASLTSNFCL